MKNENLIYIAHERRTTYATKDFEEAINKAFCYDNYLVIYDLDTNTVLLDFYCSYDTIYELKSELIGLGGSDFRLGNSLLQSS